MQKKMKTQVAETKQFISNHKGTVWFLGNVIKGIQPFDLGKNGF